METLALAILVFFSLAGFAALFFAAGGTLIILIGAFIYAAMTDFTVIGLKTLLVLTTLYLCGEMLEYVCVIVGAKKFGASNSAAAGALFGGIAGALLGAGVLGIGVFLGAFLGLFLGAFLVELLIQRDLVKSLKAGAGGVLGRIGSIVAKVLVAILMCVILLLKVLA